MKGKYFDAPYGVTIKFQNNFKFNRLTCKIEFNKIDIINSIDIRNIDEFFEAPLTFVYFFGILF
jgi:hypothetical protein